MEFYSFRAYQRGPFFALTLTRIGLNEQPYVDAVAVWDTASAGRMPTDQEVADCRHTMLHPVDIQV